MSIVNVGMSAVLAAGGALVIASPAAAATPMVTSSAVNLRSGPGTSHRVLGVVPSRTTVQATGKTSGGWTEITWSGKTGYVSTSFLRSGTPQPPKAPPTTPPKNATPPAPSSPPASTPPAATGAAMVKSTVNVRSGPGTKHRVVGSAKKGARVPTTGKKSGGWTEVIWSKAAAWISTSYLTSAPASGPGGGGGGEQDKGKTNEPLTVKAKLRTTANLYLRTSGSSKAPKAGVLPKNSVVGATGAKTAEYTQIAHEGKGLWIATRYTTSVAGNNPSTPPSSPDTAAPNAVSTVGVRYVSVRELNVRATSASNGRIVGLVTLGTPLPITGRAENNRTQIVYKGAAAWVYSPYLSASQPSNISSGNLTVPPGITTSGISRLTPNAKGVVRGVVTNFPRIRTIYGWRAGSAIAGSDHPKGRAVDAMISNYRSSEMTDYGWQVAYYFQRNAAQYKISYLIYRQKLWNAAYPGRGWRSMENRGSDTANHLDHVHISVKA